MTAEIVEMNNIDEETLEEFLYRSSSDLVHKLKKFLSSCKNTYDSRGIPIEIDDIVRIDGNGIRSHIMFTVVSEMRNMIKNGRLYRVSKVTNGSCSISVAGYSWYGKDLTIVKRGKHNLIEEEEKPSQEFVFDPVCL